jgi:hypothetical protein
MVHTVEKHRRRVDLDVLQKPNVDWRHGQAPAERRAEATVA